MLIARGVIGGILLFLGRELNFLLAAAMAGLLSFRIIPFLPHQWPAWYDYVVILGLAIIAGAIPLVNERAGYFVSGFLAGGTLLVEYVSPVVMTVPLVPFLLGGIVGSLILGIFTAWALIVISCLIGAYYITNMFTLSFMTQMLIGSGLFIIGALTQVVMMRMQKND